MNINVIVNAGEKVKQKVKYGFTLLFQPLRVQVVFSETVQTDSINILYGNELPANTGKIFIVRPSVELEQCVAESRLPELGGIEWIGFRGKKLPKLFPISGFGSKSQLDFDIAAATFTLASNFQDLISLERDEFDRLRAMDSLQDRLGVLNFPVVNYYSLFLKEKLESFFNVVIDLKEYDNAKCGLALTHDVDYTSSLNFKIIKREIFGHAILNRQGLGPNERAEKLMFPLLALLGYDPPKSGLTFLRGVELQNGLKSTFFLKTGATGKEDVNYNFHSGRIRSFYKSLADSGFEIGIHPSMKTYIDVNEFVREKTRLENLLGKKVSSVRQHYLKFTAGKTVSIWERANMKYDSTLGFSRKVGFRNSVAFPFPLYNFEQDRVSPVIELPLMLMDGTIADDKRLTTEQAFEKMKELIRETKESHGAAAILFHNSIADPVDFPGYKKIYEHLLTEAKSSGFSVGTLEGIIENFQ
ncbi:MAG: polysaccharide deacetylase family protein [Bacteroidetes bacterium]|nr:polysaccharide deacetylase family protein [Bacteroidota bacterium]MCL5738916.1 polysaccharide deacetylase family protein [Bacteroidota bacterium]